jgi:hypothetical protein
LCSGEVSFARSRFSGGDVSFEGATFSDDTVSFDDVVFSGGEVSFDHVVGSAPVGLLAVIGTPVPATVTLWMPPAPSC